MFFYDCRGNYKDVFYCIGENGVGIKIFDFIWRIRGIEKKIMIIFIIDLYVFFSLWKV